MHVDNPGTSPAIRNSTFIPGLSLGFYNMGPLSPLLWKCHLLEFCERWSHNKYGGTNIRCRKEMLRIHLSSQWPSEGSGGQDREFTLFFTSDILTIYDPIFVIWRLLRQKEDDGVLTWLYGYNLIAHFFSFLNHGCPSRCFLCVQGHSDTHESPKGKTQKY